MSRTLITAARQSIVQAGLEEDGVFGLLWGATAGGIIGMGISLSIGLFYSSALETIGAVILVSALLGALFGQVMAHLMHFGDVSPVRPKRSIAGHRISGHAIQRIDLTDHRTLKAEAQARSSALARMPATQGGHRPVKIMPLYIVTPSELPQAGALSKSQY